MTTTLRPTGPERSAADGHRSRSYEVCVNGRPVGLLQLATDSEYGPSTGRIVRLVVDERERRRGRGAVAALAAEEVLRGWGCDRVEVAVPAAEPAALGLTSQLGFRERSRTMLKELRGAPELPRGAAVRAMNDEEFAAWWGRGRPEYVRTLLAHGVPAEQAERKADGLLRRLLPAGAATRGAVLRVLAGADGSVGTLWLDVERSPHADADGYVFDVRVDERLRGRGHGRTLMLVAEREALAAGGRVLGLDVHAGNAPALALYGSLGFRTAEHHVYKPLL
jgi:GNAT superfamily N-acetyltransferase